MMNNKGQTLVMFTLFIPILVGICAFVIDMGLIFYESNKLDNLTKQVLEYGVKHQNDAKIYNKMVDLIYQNDADVDSYKINIEANKITLNITKATESFFGQMIGLNTYHLDTTMVGSLKSGQVIIRKED